MITSDKTIELCRNVEWYSQCCAGFDDHGNDTADCVDAVASQIFASLWQLGFEVVCPANGRSTLHGWNGVHMPFKYGPVGTFSEISAEQADAIEKIVDAAILSSADE